MKKVLLTCAVIVAVLYAGTVFFVPPRIDASQTRVYGTRANVSARARALHETLTIADLHADSLIWGRDLLRRNERGQVDLPRLQEGNVALQVFSVPTKVPRSRSRHGTRADQLDLLTVSAFAQGWPPATWFRRDSRALHAARLFDRFSSASNGALIGVRTREDLRALLDRRARGEKVIGGVLALEGLHSLEGKVENVDRFYEAGYRIAGLVHQFDNDLGGSSQGVARGGLSPFGREVVQRMEQRGMIVDLAHASPQLIRDVLSIATKPVLVSHTGVRGTCESPRNLSDEEVRRIAATGGVIGIGFWSGATCGRDPAAIANSIRHAVSLAGIDHVALGSDFDGDRMAFDAAALAGVTEALLKVGFSEPEIRKIMGGNLVRLLLKTL